MSSRAETWWGPFMPALALAGVSLILAAETLANPSRFTDAWLASTILAACALHVYALGGGGRSLRTARAFIVRGWRVFFSYRFQVLVVIAQLGIFALLLVLLGRTLIEALFAPVGDALSGYTSTNFVVFILLAMASFPVLWSSYQVSATRIRQEQMTGLFETLVPTARGVEPLPFAYLVSATIGSAIGLVVTLLVFRAILPPGSLILGDPVSLVSFAAVLALSIVIMWGLGLIMGGLTAVFKEAAAASNLLRILLLLFAGVYIPTTLLPGWGQTLSTVLPVTYAAQGIRVTLAHGMVVSDVLPEVGILAAFAVVTSLGGTWIFRRLLERARRAGTLYGY